MLELYGPFYVLDATATVYQGRIIPLERKDFMLV